jgi:hypothetical protein
MNNIDNGYRCSVDSGFSVATTFKETLAWKRLFLCLIFWLLLEQSN